MKACSAKSHSVATCPSIRSTTRDPLSTCPIAAQARSRSANAVQIAAAMGGRVTAVCSAVKADFVRSLGAERVLDYAREDFAASDERYRHE